MGYLSHSERRQYFGETDETVNAKMIQVLKNDMTQSYVLVKH